MTLAFRLARRELRGSGRSLGIFLACLALGVAAIAAVGSFSAAILEGLTENGRVILGGDVDLRTLEPLSDEQRQWLDRQGEVSAVLSMNAIAHAAGGEARSLISLKAVDGRYPLYGSLALVPAQAPAAALSKQDGEWGAAVDDALLRRLGLDVGERIRIGDLTYRIRARIDREPDRSVEGLSIGPRVLVDFASAGETGLVRIGSLLHYHFRVKLEPAIDLATWTAALADRFPEAGWRIRDRRAGAPGLRRFIERINLYLTLAGLSALLIGGVGVGNGVRSYLDSRRETVATLKCLGATGGLIFRVYLVQVLALAAIAILSGLAVGAAAPVVAGGLVAGLLPYAATPGPYPAPLAIAAAFGLVVALTFVVWPLGLAREIPAAGLFRQVVSRERRWPRGRYIAATVGFVVATAALTVASAIDARFAIFFVAAALALFGVFFAVARGVVVLARRAARSRSAALRLALANLHRPGAPTVSVLLSLGLGLTLLVAVVLIEGNLAAQVRERLPERAPAYFFVDIQNDQLPRFLEVATAVPGVGPVEHVPMLRGRITRVDGVPSGEVAADPDQSWVLRGDRGVTYADRAPAHNRLVAGDWWSADYRGPPLVSFEAEAARGLGLAVGETITVNVLGREITATIANLRAVDWGTLGINFVMVFDRGSFADAPHMHIATAAADTPAAEDRLFDAVTGTFANVTAVRVKDALALIDEVMAKTSVAVRAVAAVTLLAGVLVLGGAVGAGLRGRAYDAVILKVLGATRRDVLQAYLLEYLLLGGVAAVISAVAGTVASWLVVEGLMRTSWIVLPGTAAMTVLIGLLLTVAIGLAGTWRTLSVKAAPALRTA